MLKAEELLLGENIHLVCQIYQVSLELQQPQSLRQNISCKRAKHQPQQLYTDSNFCVISKNFLKYLVLDKEEEKLD